MQFLNYKLVNRPDAVVLKRDDQELGYYRTLALALQDLEHRYLLQSRTEEEKAALKQFMNEQGL